MRSGVQAAVDAARAAPLSARAALYAAVMMDRLADRDGASDILAARAQVRARCPAMGPLMDLAAAAAGGPYLQVVATPVPEDGFASLPVADLMVSLYNAGTVPRLMLVQAEEPALDMQDVLQEAWAWWRDRLGEG